MFQHDFRTVKIIKAVGGSFKQVYDYKDQAGLNFNYYRLKMVDIDGSYEYSSMIYAFKECLNKNLITVFPNQISANGEIMNVRFYSDQPEAHIQITDMLGRVVRRLTLETEINIITTVQIDVFDLSVGNYTLQILGDRKTKVFSIHG